jgi:RHS repeat-associated protein
MTMYDDLERVSSNLCSGSLWGQDFNYDVFGNITKTVPAGYTGTIFDPGYGSGNRVSGYSYDTDGDVTNDGDTLYTYNIQGRPASVSGLGITGVGVYDAFNRLVEWQTSPGGDTQLVYAPDAYKFAYMNRQAVTKYIAPLAAGLQAVYTAATPSPVAYWRHADWLGSSRLASTASQQMYFDGAYAPFGELYAGAGTSNWSNWSFTGQTMDLGNDSVTGIFDFPLRQQSPNQGRWLVPDPAGMAAVDITNPQTWNRYAYVGNNPLSNVDPLGLLYAVLPPDFSGIWGLGCGGIFCDFNWIYPILPPGGGGGGGGGHPQPKPKPKPPAKNGTTSTCVISNGKVTGVATGAGQAPGAGAFGFVPPAGSVAIDPMSLGLVRGSQANAVLGPNASQITFSFNPAPNVPSGFPTTHTLGSILDSGASVGGVNFHGQYDFDIFGFPSFAVADQVTEFAQVAITYPSSLPVNCGGYLADPPLAGPIPAPEPVAAIALRPEQ